MVTNIGNNKYINGLFPTEGNVERVRYNPDLITQMALVVQSPYEHNKDSKARMVFRIRENIAVLKKAGIDKTLAGTDLLVYLEPKD